MILRACLKTSRRQDGFSLVEVSLAIVVVAMGLLAVLGLLPTGIQASRDAADRTLAATMVNDVFSQLRVDPFNSCVIPTNADYTGSVTVNLSNPPSSITWTYTQAGFLPGASDEPYFQLTLQSTNLLTGLALVQATVVWPWKGASSKPVITNIFITQIAQYE